MHVIEWPSVDYGFLNDTGTVPQPFPGVMSVIPHPRVNPCSVGLSVTVVV